MFSKIRNRILNLKAEYSVIDLLDNVKEIVEKGNAIAICPQPTGPNWKGISIATENLFTGIKLEIPQFYSNQLITDEEFKELFIQFKALGGEKVIINGFPKYFSKWVGILKELELKVFVVFHGGLSEFSGKNPENISLGLILDLFKKNQIDRFAVVKKGLDLLLTSLTGKKVYRIHPNVKPLEIRTSERTNKKTQIGVFSNDSYNKNRHNQVAAALMVENSEVHILGNNEFSYFGMDDRLKVHKELDHEAFLNLIGKMDVNLYLSYSESWGQIVTESISKGIPCLTSSSSGIYDCNKYLTEQLVINENDNPIEISKQLIKVLEFDFQNEFSTYLEILNKNSETLTSEFLNS